MDIEHRRSIYFWQFQSAHNGQMLQFSVLNYSNFEIVDNLSFDAEKNDFIINYIPIVQTSKSYFEIGDSDSTHLTIKYDNHYFKSKRVLKRVNPRINVNPVELAWPTNKIKTGEISIDDFNTNFSKNYDVLYQLKIMYYI